MTSSAIANRYASALADVVTGPSGIDAAQATQQLRGFEALLAESPELQHALTSPAVPPGRKRAVVSKLAERLGAARIVRNFLLVLTDHRRITALAQIIESFEVQLDERLGFVRAELQSARELGELEKALLTAELSRLTGKKVRTRFAIAPELIGGVVARIGSTVYDGSVRGKLASLAHRLAAE
ncbi:MAG TPA: ATP synthase F1 subunit delta [Bryobacteraceae bacterium]|nr:ATP synthase F1 subunit delta [Bryobacteraceae bacterium]